MATYGEMFFEAPKKIRGRLSYKNITQMQMAKDFRVDPGYLSKVLSGWIVPNFNTQDKIAKYLGMKRKDIWVRPFEENPDYKPKPKGRPKKEK